MCEKRSKIFINNDFQIASGNTCSKMDYNLYYHLGIVGPKNVLKLMFFYNEGIRNFIFSMAYFQEFIL